MLNKKASLTTRRKFILSAAVAGIAVSLLKPAKICGSNAAVFNAFAQDPGEAFDFAESSLSSAWLQHPVLGGPSFDSFERLPGNPVWRGEAPLEWSVNGFLLLDPVSNNLFIYVGAYAIGYMGSPSRCIGLRSADEGKTWEKLGTMIEPDAALFDKGGHTPDVSVVYDAGKYHMIYDWGETDFNKEGGIAYAWAEKPEGPWHRVSAPVTRNSTLPLMKDRYRRTYAATLIRRANDWMITGMMDDAPRSWALFVMTADKPEGPYTERKLVRDVREDYFHPPLMEFFPSFVHDGYLYAPATSVAMNRNYAVLYRAPLESATNPAAWQPHQVGSLWHSEDVEAEYEGLWGQIFSGQVDKNGILWAMFPSRDKENRGTINVAKRNWNKPFKENGFVLTAHAGPAITLLKKAYTNFELNGVIELRGIVRFLWNYTGILGPNAANSDAAVGNTANRHYHALELSATSWKVIVNNSEGLIKTVAQGTLPEQKRRAIFISRNKMKMLQVSIDGINVWEGAIDNGIVKATPLGIWLEPRSHLKVASFKVTGYANTARIFFDATDALLGAGEDTNTWQHVTDGVRSVPAYTTTTKNARAKWNVHGSAFSVWSPAGPQFGKMEIVLNGVSKGVIDLYAEKFVPSKIIWRSEQLSPGYHAIVLKPVSGNMVVDGIEAEQ